MLNCRQKGGRLPEVKGALIVKIGRYAFVFFLAVFFFAPTGNGAEKMPPVMQEIAVSPKLGAQIPLEEEFINERGETVTLASFFDGKRPVVFVLNYYGCPMLCGLLLNGTRDGLQSVDWIPGQQYKIVTISIDPKEGPDLALSKKESLLESMESEDFKSAARDHWHFLVGKDGSEARVAAAMGFGYKWVPEENQFAHGAALFIAATDGKLSRVLPGISFSSRDLKFAMLEASEGKVGSFAEKIALFCYHWDPTDSKFVLLASRLVSIGGAVTVFAFLLGYLVLFLRNRRKGNACSLSP